MITLRAATDVRTPAPLRAGEHHVLIPQDEDVIASDSLCFVAALPRHRPVATERRAALFFHGNQHFHFSDRSSGPHHSLGHRPRISASRAIGQLQHRRAIPADEPRAPPVRRRADCQPAQCRAEQPRVHRTSRKPSPSQKGLRRKAFRWAGKNSAPCRPAMSKPILIWCASSDPSAGRIWLISSDTLTKVPELYDQVEARQVERKLPSVLVKHEVAGVPLWQWLACCSHCP